MKARRAPLLAIGLLSMAIGVLLGLVRLGWSVPTLWTDRPDLHGPLMIGGFLGTLISLERAVALGARWAYAAPVVAAGGAIALQVSPGPAGPLLMAAASAGLVATTLAVMRRQPSFFIATMLGGAVAWAVGTGLWLAGIPLFQLVSWWLAFLVLTIAGERLELNRLLRPTPLVRAAFVAAVGFVAAGLAASLYSLSGGTRLCGAGLVALAVWLARYDLARRTVHQQGLTRYMAVALLSGYVWLGAGGLLAVVHGITAPGLVYDATVHAILVGFVMSMIFAHAPVIFPALLGRPLPYRPAFYVHLAVLHASVAIRLAGDLIPDLSSWRLWGGLLNAIAIALFVANVVSSIVIGARSARGDAALVRDARLK